MLNNKYFQTHQETYLFKLLQPEDKEKKCQPRFHTQRKYFIELKEKERLLQEKNFLRAGPLFIP